MILAGKMVELKEAPPDPGLTTEIAMRDARATTR